MYGRLLFFLYSYENILIAFTLACIMVIQSVSTKYACGYDYGRKLKGIKIYLINFSSVIQLQMLPAPIGLI